MQSWGTRHALATAGAAGASQAGPDLHHRDASALFTFITFNVPERRCYYRAAQVGTNVVWCCPPLQRAERPFGQSPIALTLPS